MRQRTSVMLVALAIAACSRGDDRSAPTRTASTVDAAADRARLLLDSASTFLTRGDSASARRALAAANALASSDPELVYRVAVAQENVGDVGPAARAYRRYLSLAPSGVDAADANARLTALITGVPTTTQLASGETVAPPSNTGLSDPAISGSDATTPPSAGRSTASRVARAARPVRRPARVATRPVTQRRVASTAGAATGPIVAPTPVASRVAVAEPTMDSAPMTAAPAAAETTMARSAMTSMEVPKIHYSRWSRVQTWFVAKIAGLGGTGGAVVGAIIGNVPGAIAIGLAGGAAGGLAKVHQDKVDSARALKTAARTVRDSSAGEVDLLLVPDSTHRDSVRHAGMP